MCCRSPPVDRLLPTLLSQLVLIVLKGIKRVICIADHPQLISSPYTIFTISFHCF